MSVSRRTRLRFPGGTAKPAAALRCRRRSSRSRSGGSRAAWKPRRSAPADAPSTIRGCAARACPPLAFYDGERLDAQLDLAARTFVTHDTEIAERAREVRVSPIYRRYLRDFGGDDDGVRRLLARHADDELRARLARAFAGGHELAHRRHDWDLNGLAAARAE